MVFHIFHISIFSLFSIFSIIPQGIHVDLSLYSFPFFTPFILLRDAPVPHCTKVYFYNGAINSSIVPGLPTLLAGILFHFLFIYLFYFSLLALSPYAGPRSRFFLLLFSQKGSAPIIWPTL